MNDEDNEFTFTYWIDRLTEVVVWLAIFGVTLLSLSVILS